MADEQDWRLLNQESYLRGVRLQRKRYRAYSESWEHDHCSFCWATFSELDEPDELHEGYATEDDYYWICDTCYEDFKGRFQWELVR
jgi:hypothetical protein